MDQIKTVLFVFALGLAATAQDTAPAQTQQPCPSGYHHEAGSAACWPDVSRQESHAAVQPPSALPSTQPPTVPAQPMPSQPAQTQPVQQVQAQDSNNKASLVVFREESKWIRNEVKIHIFIDGVEITAIEGGNYLSAHQSNQENTLSVQANR